MKTSATLISYLPSQTVSAPTRKSRQSTIYDGGSKIYKHPWVNRRTLSEGYECELSGREAWWRSYIRITLQPDPNILNIAEKHTNKIMLRDDKETPIPGAYDLEKQSWIYEIEQKPNTYRFKSDGRKIDPQPHGKGTELLPGAYKHCDFLERFEKIPATYGFKTAERDKYDALNFGKKDKDVNVSPDAYAVEKYASLTAERLPSKHSMFKSQAKRFPTLQFKPKEGPAPGNYETSTHISPRIEISSSFKSRTPRFSSSHTRVPGPGMYEKTFQSSLNGVLQKMGRQHGLFFSSAFQYD